MSEVATVQPRLGPRLEHIGSSRGPAFFDGSVGFVRCVQEGRTDEAAGCADLLFGGRLLLLPERDPVSGVLLRDRAKISFVKFLGNRQSPVSVLLSTRKLHRD